MAKRLAILTTHPIQYQAPWFRSLALEPSLDVEVLFCHRATPGEQSAAGFGVEFSWDSPLLEGYKYRFLRNVSREPGIRGFSGLDTPEVKRLIAAGRYDAVVVNGWHYKSAWQAFNSCWGSGVPVMARSDSHLHTPRHPLKRAAKWFSYRRFITRLDACLPVGRWSEDYFIHYGARPERIFRVPHVVDGGQFSEEEVRRPPRRSRARGRLGLRGASVVFLFAGKFTDVKRPMDFVRGVEAAATRGPKVEGLMVGDGPLRAACAAYAEERNVPVRFAGFLNQSEIVDAYAASDVLVLPSNDETWGMVVTEAMSCGRPCLVSDRVGCRPDLIIPGETGDVFPVGDVGALAQLMARYASDPGRLRDMGAHAAARVSGYATESASRGTVRAVEAVTAPAGARCTT